jgi:hypothetical protein
MRENSCHTILFIEQWKENVCTCSVQMQIFVEYFGLQPFESAAVEPMGTGKDCAA